MGTKVTDPREIVLTMRLTRKEHIQLLGEVDRAGYHSVSRYIRERIIDGKRVFRSSSPLTGGEVRDRLNSISTDIAQYGSDYTVVAHELKGLMDNGAARLNPRTASVYLGKLVRLSHSIKSGMDETIRLFGQIERQAGSSGEEPMITIKKQQKMLQKIEIIGNLTADAELKTGKEDKQYILFRVAVNDVIGDTKTTTFYDVSCPSGGLLNILKKGREVYVSGRLTLSLRTWEGKTYLNARVFAKDIELCGSRDC